MSPGFKAYAKQVKANAVALGNYLMGNKLEKVCEKCNITVNRNPIIGDSSAVSPGGVRIVEKEFEEIGEFLHRAVTIALNVQNQHGKLKLLKDFIKGLENNKDIQQLKVDVPIFASSFHMPTKPND
ncbi:hypothetical protein V6N13_053648 [Hibiscus sabdariffa]